MKKIIIGCSVCGKVKIASQEDRLGTMELVKLNNGAYYDICPDCYVKIVRNGAKFVSVDIYKIAEDNGFLEELEEKLIKILEEKEQSE
jgi:hypothetical protein